MSKKRIFLTIIDILLVLTSIGGMVVFFVGNMDLLINQINHLIFFLASALLFVISLGFLIGTLVSDNERKKSKSLKERLSMWNSISYKVKKAGESAFNDLPIGILVLNNKTYDILWSNKSGKDIFKSELENLNLKDISLDIYSNLLINKYEFEIVLYGIIYECSYNSVDNILYLTNVDEYHKLQIEHDNSQLSVGYISIDNFEQALSTLDVQDKAEYTGKIIGMITEWFEKYGSYIRAITDSKFVVIFDKKTLKEIMDSKLTILDDIKSFTINNAPLRISLSIGISSNKSNIVSVSDKASELLSFAINRGGDQAIIEVDGKRSAFGAKEENSLVDEKIDVRVKSEELQYLMSNSSNVIIMPHKNTDTDGFGSALLLLKMAESLDKEAYIVLEEVDSTVKKILNTVEKEYITLSEKIITSKKASSFVDSNTLLMIVDFQGINQSPEDYKNKETLGEKLLKKVKHIGIIDHHRRGNDAISSTDFYYSKTSSSSSVEILMELFEFWKNKFEISEIEATWMLLGVIVDTNNFLYRVNVKTFEISSMLKQYGADLTEVQRYLKEMPDELNRRLSFLNNITYIGKHIAVSKATNDAYYERQDLAKISDDLMDLENVELGLTIGRLDYNTVGISARSLGKINAQSIMERLGGGGHFTSAATQIKDKTIDEVYNSLIETINTFYTEDNKSKVIFLKDIKGFGSKYEIKTISHDDAERFLNDKVVYLATQQNIQMIEDEKNKEAIEAEQINKKALTTKGILEKEAKNYTVEVSNGVLKNPITDNDIKKFVYKTFNINFLNKQIILLEPIKKLGAYNIEIQLTKDVFATLVLYVCER